MVMGRMNGKVFLWMRFMQKKGLIWSISFNMVIYIFLNSPTVPKGLMSIKLGWHGVRSLVWKKLPQMGNRARQCMLLGCRRKLSHA